MVVSACQTEIRNSVLHFHNATIPLYITIVLCSWNDPVTFFVNDGVQRFGGSDRFSLPAPNDGLPPMPWRKAIANTAVPG